MTRQTTANIFTEGVSCHLNLVDFLVGECFLYAGEHLACRALKCVLEAIVHFDSSWCVWDDGGVEGNQSNFNIVGYGEAGRAALV